MWQSYLFIFRKLKNKVAWFLYKQYFNKKLVVEIKRQKVIILNERPAE